MEYTAKAPAVNGTLKALKGVCPMHTAPANARMDVTGPQEAYSPDSVDALTLAPFVNEVLQVLRPLSQLMQHAALQAAMELSGWSSSLLPPRS
jgi:hypothetical protein